ncbi:flagellar assembly peptidoglycan hydrolase FlgJ [Pseudomonas sp. SWI44]|uniref:flagellar assembly peptidoglycan hydrolase FlgJ n=1 Tax=Pseudomonas sp. SWI44 TaxID=2083053 RepID=UPI000CE5DF9A|nr:flagellar assembly peptidoglycan hydrolase FlgJ [Pseudomonas sp. SWI44]AVD88275.1 flagellar assembly peptidoglycan hydrolase FlgJ [Pseudomonas sp. SWI44]
MSIAEGAAGFALDVQGLQRLRSQASRNGEAGLKEAARQFEALFLQNMLKSMRAAIPKSELSSNSQTELYTELLDQQWAQTLAGRGMGLAEQLTRSLSGRALAPGVGIGETQLPMSVAPASGESPFVGMTRHSVAYESWKRHAVSADDTDRADHVEAFVARLAGPARKAERSSGVPAELILAQAALETDWGRRRITTADGADSYNLFGIKAGGRWQGEIARVTTTEYVAGEAQQQKESFRVYPNAEAAFDDYARLIRSRPGYAAARNAANNTQAAIALQEGGYATDPRYAQKLVAVMATIGPLPAAGAEVLADGQ